MYKKLKEYKNPWNKDNYFIQKKYIMSGRYGFYCPKCFGLIEGSTQKEKEIYKSHWSEDKPRVVCTCSKCSESFAIEADYWNRPNDENVYITTSPRQSFVNSISIWHDEERGLLKYFASETYSAATPKFIKWEARCIKLVVNLKTHNSYLIYSKLKPREDLPIIRNVNNATCCIFKNLISYDREFVDTSKEAVCFFKDTYNKLTGSNILCNTPDFTSAFDKIVLNNRYAFLQEDNKDFKIYDYPKIIRKYIPRDKHIDKVSWIQDFTKEHDLPFSKAFKKLYYKNIDYVFRCLLLKLMGFNNPDIILALLNGCEQDLYESIYDIRYIKKAIKRRGESLVCKDILSEKTYITRDLIYMYKKVWKANKGLLDKSLYSMSLRKAHDTLSSLQISLKYENKKVRYSKKERALSDTYGSLHFDLPKDTNELILVGQEMGICVGSYRDKVLSKRCTIVTIKDKDDYIGCIELQGLSLIQLKSKFNNPLDTKYKPVFDKWADKNELEYKENWDYKNIKKENKHASHYDYHQVEIHNGIVQYA